MGLADDTEEVEIDNLGTPRRMKIRTSLSPEVRETVIACLRRNRDVFAWSHNDMKSIDPDLICHRLNVDPRVPTRRQKKRPLDPERSQALKDEVDKLIGPSSFAKRSMRYMSRTRFWSQSQMGDGDAA